MLLFSSASRLATVFLEDRVRTGPLECRDGWFRLYLVSLIPLLRRVESRLFDRSRSYPSAV